MDIFSKDDLKILVNAQTVGCISISIYMPTVKPGRVEVQQNPSRFKNLLRDAEERLVKMGLRGPEAERYLKPARSLLDDNAFWVDMSDGLAVFLSKDFFRRYRLPVQFPERVTAAERFQVKPLLPMLSVDGRFYVMAVSPKAIRLLQGTQFGFDELDIAGKVPRSLAEALRFEEGNRDRQLQHHTRVGGAGLGGATIAHGDDIDDTKENLLRYFYLVDRSLQREFLHEETAPLVIVGVDYLFPIYKEANTYANLLDTSVEGSPDKMSSLELHKLAAKIVQPYFGKRQDEARQLYQKFLGGRSTDKLAKIVSESYHGRVYILFVAADQQKWGTYDSSADKVAIHSKEEACDIDLLDFVAAQTLAHRGEVYALETDKLPSEEPAAAVLRY